VQVDAPAAPVLASKGRMLGAGRADSVVRSNQLDWRRAGSTLPALRSLATTTRSQLVGVGWWGWGAGVKLQRNQPIRAADSATCHIGLRSSLILQPKHDSRVDELRAAPARFEYDQLHGVLLRCSPLLFTHGGSPASSRTMPGAAQLWRQKRDHCVRAQVHGLRDHLRLLLRAVLCRHKLRPLHGGEVQASAAVATARPTSLLLWEREPVPRCSCLRVRPAPLQIRVHAWPNVLCQQYRPGPTCSHRSSRNTPIQAHHTR
jgi:hypothetical protein